MCIFGWQGGRMASPRDASHPWDVQNKEHFLQPRKPCSPGHSSPSFSARWVHLLPASASQGCAIPSILVVWGASKTLTHASPFVLAFPEGIIKKKRLCAMAAHLQNMCLPVSHSPWRLCRQTIQIKAIRTTTCDDLSPTTLAPAAVVCNLKENTINLFCFCLPRKQRSPYSKACWLPSFRSQCAPEGTVKKANN